MLSSTESPVIFITLKPWGLKSLQVFEIFLQLFVIFDKVSLPPLRFLTLVFNVPEARLFRTAAAPRYSPTKTHMHFESLVKKSL